MRSFAIPAGDRMELVLEQREMEALLRSALAAKGIAVPEDATFHFRQNHKKRTQRGIFKTDKPDLRNLDELLPK